jgi:hypothetical protein
MLFHHVVDSGPFRIHSVSSASCRRGDRRLTLSPSAAKHIFTVKSIFLPVSAFAFIGGLVHLAGGSLDLNIINPAKPASNAAFSWAFLQGLNAIFGVSNLHVFLLSTMMLIKLDNLCRSRLAIAVTGN